MSPVNLFRKIGNRAQVLEDKPFSSEKELQKFFEANLLEFVGINFLATEYWTGPPHNGRIDTLGLDTDGRPVVIEYKRRSDENVINQGLFYLDWLRNHETVFRRLVHTELKNGRARKIDFDNVWLLCVAWEFSDWDLVAARNSRLPIVLALYQRFGEELFSIEIYYSPEEDVEQSTSDLESALLTEAAPEPGQQSGVSAKSLPDFYEVSGWLQAGEELRALCREVCELILALGQDVRIVRRKGWVAFKGKGESVYNIAVVVLRPGSQCLHIHAAVDPASVKLEPGFTEYDERMAEQSLYRCPLKITIRSRKDIRRAQPLLQKAYSNHLNKTYPASSLKSAAMYETGRSEAPGLGQNATISTDELDEYEYIDFLCSNSERLALFAALREYIESLGSKVQTYARKTYIGFGNLEGNRPHRLAIMKVYKREEGLHVQVDVSEEIVEQATGEHPSIMYRAWERVASTFYYENLAIEIRSLADLDDAKPYLRAGYNEMLTRLVRP